MNHLLVGAGIPFLVAAIIYLFRRLRASAAMLAWTPIAMFLGATWAVLPDLPRAFGFAGFQRDISMNPGIDIFFWHYTINLHESASPLFSIVFVGMLLALFLAGLRELRALEEPRQAGH